MLVEIIRRRVDGTFVGLVNGAEYHIIPDDAFAPAGLWDWAVAEAARLGDDLPLEPGPPPAVPVVPAFVRKLALVRALREVALDGDSDNPVKAWPLIRSAIEAADEDTREDWTLAVEIPRNDPALAAIADALDVPANVLDAVFIRATQIAG